MKLKESNTYRSEYSRNNTNKITNQVDKLTMIANISKSGSSYFGAVQYNQIKVNNGKAAIIGKQQIPNTSPFQADKYLRVVAENDRVKRPVLHISLSFSERDKAKLNDAFLLKIGQEYLDKMGYGKQPYIIYRHDDTAHPHIHIVSTRINTETLKKIPDHHERRRSKSLTNSLEKKYDLTIANHQSKRHQRIEKDVQKALKYAPTTIAQLNRNLSKQGSGIRIKTAGRGMMYYKVEASNPNYNRKSKTWKASDFKAVGLDKTGLQNQFQQHQTNRNTIKKVIQNSLNTTKTPLHEFEKRLSKSGISTHYSINEKGVYGLSYMYQNKQFKASDVDKNNSWSTLQNKLDLPEYFQLREQLKDSIHKGKPIQIDYKDGQYTVQHSDKILQNSLQQLPHIEAMELSKLHNQQIENVPKLNEKGFIKELQGDDIDEYLQRKYEYNQRLQQRKIKHKR